MIFTVYAIYNMPTDKIYIGQTSNLQKRLLRHNGILKNKPKSFTNINKGKWSLVYKEKFSTRSEALKREKELKSYQGRLFIKKIIQKMSR